MKLQARFKKTLTLTAVATTLFSCMPAVAFASDYTGHWAEQTINEWKNKGVIDGYEDGSFKPKQEVTRAELAKMLTKVFGLTYTEGAAKYNDVAADAWYASDVKVVSAAGIMLGENGNFRPSEIATREEAAYAIATAYHVTGQAKSEYKDQADISKFAVEAVNALTANGYMNGYPEDGTFRPQGSLTRAEAVTMLDKITAEILNTAGTYTQDTQGNLVVNVKDVVLKDMVINGNLYLAEGIGEGDVTLDGVTVTGNIIVEGGGINTVSMKGKSKIKNVVVSKAGKKPVRLAVAGTVAVTGTVEVTSATVIEGTSAKIPAIIVNGAETLEIKGTTTVETITVEKKVAMTLAKESKVKEVTVEKTAEGTKLTGNGTVEKLHTEAEKVTIGSGVTVDKTTTAEGVTPPTIDKPAGGGGGNGNGGSTSETATALDKVFVSLVAGGPVEISVANHAIKVDATGKDVLINTKAFAPEMEIKSVKATANDNAIAVSIVPGTEDDIILQTNTDYTIKNLAVKVNEKQAYVKTLVDKFVADKTLTEEQGVKAHAYIKEIFNIFNQSANQDSVSVASIQHYITEAKAKIVKHGGVDRINKEFSAILSFLDASISQDKNGVITVNFKLSVDGNSHYAEKVNIELKF